MDATLVWTVVGSMAGVAGAAFAAVGYLQAKKDRERVFIPPARPARWLPAGIAITARAAAGRLPGHMRGRDDLLTHLYSLVRTPDMRVHVLTGPEGAGKSTVAHRVAEEAARLGRPAWWVPAADPGAVMTKLLSLAEDLGASPGEVTEALSGRRDPADLLWRFLEAQPGWLLVFDGVDNPGVLAADGNDVGAGGGWLRPSASGLVIVTSRESDPRLWGQHAELHAVGWLGTSTGVRVLDDLVPGTGRCEDAAVLPDRPDGLPRVWNIPARNPGFIGRDELLAALRARLAGDPALVQVLHGMGGVGKTQLAAEYAHRFSGSYDLAWWISSDQARLIGDQFAALGAELQCTKPGAGIEEVRSAVLGELRVRGRWLLVFDDAGKPADVSPWLPGGGGHVLITSRSRVWAEIAVPAEVDVPTRAESVVMLRHRVPGLSGADAGQLSAELGDLPLAVAQASAFMTETGMPAARYLELLRTQAGQLLDQAVSGSSYPRSLAAATRLAAGQLELDDPAAGQLASLCAFLGPEPIPEDLFTAAAAALPATLTTQAADPLEWPKTVAYLARQSLVRVDQRGLVMHRLTQAVLRDRLALGPAADARACIQAILASADPGDPDNPATWPRWAQLLPHLLAADLPATGYPGLRRTAGHACSYLLARGDISTAHDLADNLYQHWRERSGDDHEDTLAAATYLATSLRAMNRYDQARILDQDTWNRRRQTLGTDHPITLFSAITFALDLYELGDIQAARDLAERTLGSCRQVLGPDHAHSLSSAITLAGSLRALGETETARDLDQDTLDRCRRTLDADHTLTLASAHNLAADLRALGEIQAARDLDQDTLERCRMTLGASHPYTLASARNLEIDLRALAETDDQPRSPQRPQTHSHSEDF